MTRRILFVAMQNSVHVARWIAKLQDSSYELHLFPVSSEPAHELLSKVTIHWPRAPLHLGQLVRTARSRPLSLFRPSDALLGGNEVDHKFLQRWPTIQWPTRMR